MSPKRTATLSGWAVDNPEAEAMAVQLFAMVKEQGWRIRHGWDRRGPFPLWGDVPAFVDHPYMLSRVGAKLYVAEPYGVFWGWHLLLDAEARGWNVSISGRALWYPGATVALIFSRHNKGMRAVEVRA